MGKLSHIGTILRQRRQGTKLETRQGDLGSYAPLRGVACLLLGAVISVGVSSKDMSPHWSLDGPGGLLGGS